ncbi:MAG: hypothetical protein ACFB2W_15630 [Leptolyngbyaceae cyanobacterium]
MLVAAVKRTVAFGTGGTTSEAKFMDKRQLRKAAAAEFMQSLEHLDELLGDAVERGELDDSASTSDSQTFPTPRSKPASRTKRQPPKA